MSDAFHGADVAALRQQAVLLHDASQVLVACARRTGEGLQALVWRGRDADRALVDWERTHAPVLLRSAQQLQEAALHLLDEAARQEQASAATGGATAPSAPPGGGTWDTLRARIDAVHTVLDDSLTTLSYATNTADGLAVLTALTRWENVRLTSSYAVMDQAMGIVQSAQIGPVLGGVLQGAAVAGVATDAYGVYREHAAGNLYGTVDNAVGAVLGVGTLVPPVALASTGLAASWQAGTWAGEQLDTAMEGTDFEARFTERMRPAFDLGGAWGVLNTPGALLVTAAEEVAIRADEAWDGLTGPADGTLDARR